MAIVPRETLSATRLTEALLLYAPDLSPELCKNFSLHYEMLCRWNATHNLTRIVDPDDAALLHYIDSLLPLQWIEQPASIVDIGSGTGLPGIAAAAWWPAARVVLVDSSAKKISFLRSVRAQLANPNLEVVQGRCEDIPPQSADLALVRATFKWPEIPGLVHRHLVSGGRLHAYLGQSAPSLAEWTKVTADSNLVDAEVKKYTLPGEKHVRHAATARKE